MKKPDKKRLYCMLFLFLFAVICAAGPAAAGVRYRGWETTGNTARLRTTRGYAVDEVVNFHGNYYYLDKNGYRKTGWVKWKKHRYYFDEKTGAALTGAVKIDGSLYLFRADGTLITKPERRSLNGKTYILDSKARAIEVRSGKITAESLKNGGIDRCSRLMIVAHPDDEIFWGGSHLMQTHDFFVVCLTNGDNAIRKNEFMKALEATGSHGIILTYPDRINGVKCVWNESVMAMIRSDIWLLLNYKEWKQIVTHNPEGEYGHIHHKMTNTIVTGVCSVCGVRKSLYYFGKYFAPDQVKRNAGYLNRIRIPNGNLKRKDAVLKRIYASQSRSYDTIKHMLAYEGWIAA